MVRHNQEHPRNADEAEIHPVCGDHLVNAEPCHGNPDQAYRDKGNQHHQDEVE